MLPALSNEQMYELTSNTRTYNERGGTAEGLPGGISKVLKEFSIPLEEFATEEQYKEIYENLDDAGIAIRNHPANQKQKAQPN